jgi:hypothetical protein
MQLTKIEVIEFDDLRDTLICQCHPTLSLKMKSKYSLQIKIQIIKINVDKFGIYDLLKYWYQSHLKVELFNITVNYSYNQL